MLLCDFAQAAEGKLYLNGAGWVIKGAAAPMGVAMLIGVPWNQTNRRHHWQLSLVTADGQPVLIETPVGAQPVVVDSDFEVGRPPGVPQGIDIPLPIAVNFGPLPLAPDSQFEWRVEIDGAHDEQWTLSFFTPPSGPPALTQ